MEEHCAPGFAGMWVPDFICDKIKRGEVSPTAALIWALVAVWDPRAGWHYVADDADMAWVSEVLGVAEQDVAATIEAMKANGVLK